MPLKKIIFAAFFFLSFCTSGCNVRIQKTGSEMTIDIGIARSTNQAEVIPVNVDGKDVALILMKGPNYGTNQVWRWSSSNVGQNRRDSLQPESLRELRSSGHETNQPEYRKTVTGSGDYRNIEPDMANHPNERTADGMGGLCQQCPDGQPSGRGSKLLWIQSVLQDECGPVGCWLDCAG